MANLLFGYRLKEADGLTDVTGAMKAATYGSTADKARLYYLELYAYRESGDTGGDLRLDGFDVKVAFSDTILASLKESLTTLQQREAALTVDSALPLFRAINFGAVSDGANTVRFTAGSSSSIDAGGEGSAFPTTGSGLTIAAGDEEVLATIKLDINDTWDKTASNPAPSPAINGAQVNIDDTVVTLIDSGQVKSIRELHSKSDTAASFQDFTATVGTEVDRAAQALTAADADDAANDSAFSNQIGTVRNVGLASSVTTNLIRKGTTFEDSARLINMGESALVDIEALKTGSIQNGSVTLTIQQRASANSSWSSDVEIAHNQSSAALLDVNYSVDSAGSVTARGEISITRMLVADGAVGSVLIQDGAGGVDVQAYADGESIAGVISSIAGTTSKNLITYQGDLNYDGRVSMKDLAFLNAGAEAWNGGNGTYHAEVDADFSGGFDIADLAVLNDDWGGSLHTQPLSAVTAANGEQINRSYSGNADLSWSELSQQGSYTWDNTSFNNQSVVEAGSDFVDTLT
jgi:hypothetical protein